MPKRQSSTIGEPGVDIGRQRDKRRRIRQWGVGVLLAGALNGCVWLERATAPPPAPHQTNYGAFWGPEECPLPIPEPDAPENEQKEPTAPMGPLTSPNEVRLTRA